MIQEKTPLNQSPSPKKKATSLLIYDWFYSND